VKNNISPKISVIIITYNQEDLIKRALNSILIQKEWVYEIIVCDDCSTDNNWEVILNYANQYPDLIKPYRNEYNLGIFGNIENTWSKPTGDIIFNLSGDDEFCNGLFEEAIKFIEQKSIDYQNELFCLYFDYKIVWIDNKSKIYFNKMIEKDFNPISLKVRSLISNRTTGFSAKILKKFSPVRKDIGLYADGLQDIQLQLFSTHNYYSSFVGSIYHAGIGIAERTSGYEHYKSKILVDQEFEKMLNFSKKDKYYLLFYENKILLSISPTLKQLLITIKYYILSLDLRYGLNGMQMQLIWEYLLKLKSKI
jgi:glycosyltransferase involved in cell wall biosynthesis